MRGSHRFWVCLAALLFGLAPLSRGAGPVVVVDLLVLYTPAAREASGISIRENIRLAVAEANLVYGLSDTGTRIRLAHCAEIEYRESGSVATDLERLRQEGDGFLNSAHLLRDEHRADLVCLITETGPDWTFYGLQGPSERNAFSVIRRHYLTGSYFLPIVLGFNFGIQLDRNHADSVGAFPFSYGHTLLLGDTPFGTADSFSAPRLPFLSNPEQQFDGVPLGIPEGAGWAANNVRTIRLTAPIAAAFRGEVDRVVPPTVHLTAPVAGNFSTDQPVQVLAQADVTSENLTGVDFFAVHLPAGSPQHPHYERVWGAAAPFGWSWWPSRAGEFLLAAVATDTNGITGVAEPVRISVALANDDFADAIRLSGNDIYVAGSTWAATREPDETGDQYESVWYIWQAPASGLLCLNVTPEYGASKLAVLQGSSVSNLTEMGRVVMRSPKDPSKGETMVNAGEDYYVVVNQGRQYIPEPGRTNPGAVAGPFAFHLELIPPTGNDNFSNRFLLAGPQASATGDLTGATVEPDEPDHGISSGALRSVWWSWMAPETGEVLLTWEAAGGFKPYLAVYQGDALADLQLRVATGPSSYAPTLFQAEAGQSYAFAFAGTTPRYGVFDWQIEMIPVPANDDFENRSVLTGSPLVLQANTRGASSQDGEIWSGQYPYARRTLWWEWTADQTGWVKLRAIGQTGIPSALRAFRGTSLNELVAVLGFYPLSGFWAENGETFVLNAASTDRDAGSFELELTTIEPPENDAFASSVTIAGERISLVVTGVVSTFEPGEPEPPSNTYGSLWFSWVAPYSGLTVLDRGPWWRPRVFTGNAVASLQEVPLTIVNGPLAFDAEGGQTYRIAFLSPQLRPETLAFDLFLTQGPANDAFENSTVLHGLRHELTGFTYLAEAEASEPGLPGRSVWYSWTAPGTAWVEAYCSMQVATYVGETLDTLTPVGGNVNEHSLKFLAQEGVTYHFRIASNPAGLGQTFTFDLEQSAVHLVAPTTDAVFAEGEAVTAVAEVIEVAQPLDRVDFYRDYSRVNSLTNGPYAIVIPGLVPGRHRVSARAYEADQHGSVSQDVWFTVLPANDDFANRVMLTGSSTNFTAYPTAATSEPGEPVHAAGLTNQSVWYSWIAPGDGMVSVSEGYTFSTIYIGDSLANLVRVTGDTNGNFSFPVQGGAVYQIAVNFKQRPYGGFSAPVQISWQEQQEPPPPAPDNDAFADAIVVSGYDEIQCSHTSQATRETGEPDHGSSAKGRTVWFKWQTPFSGPAQITLESGQSGFLGVYEGDILEELTPLATSTYGRLTFEAVTGESYNVVVDDTSSSLVDGFCVHFSQIRARITSPAEGQFLSAFHGIPIEVELTGGPTQIVQIEFLNRWAFPPANVVGVVTNPPFSFVWMNASAGSHSLIARATDDQGNITDSLPVTVTVHPSNDDFVHRSPLSGPTGLVSGTTFRATTEPGENLVPPATGTNTVWYTWSAPMDGQLVVRAESLGGFTSLPLFWPPSSLGLVSAQSISDYFAIGWTGPPPEIILTEGTSITNLDVVAVSGVVSLDYSSAQYALIEAPVNAGDEFQFAACSRSNLHSGRFNLSWEIRPVAPNDLFANRVPITNYWIEGSNVRASSEPGEPPPPPLTDSMGKSVWFTWRAESDGIVTLGMKSDFAIATFVGDEISTLLPISLSTVTKDWSEAQFYARHGTDYQIAVIDRSGKEGEFNLYLDPPAANPQIEPSTATVSDGRYEMQLSGQTGQAFALQASSDLLHWETILIDTFQGNWFDYVESDIDQHPNRFYRLMPLAELLLPKLSLLPPVILPDRTAVVEVQGPPGQPFRLQSSEDLLHWENLGSGVVFGPSVPAHDSRAPASATRFYRVIEDL